MYILSASEKLSYWLPKTANKKTNNNNKNPVDNMTLKMSPSAEVNIGNKRSVWDDL